MEWLFPLLRFRNKYLYCLGIRRSIRNGYWILFSIIIAMTAGILIVCFTLTRPRHPCHFGLKRVMKSSIVSSSRPRSIAVGDFNNDHYLDIVVANSGTNTIGIFLSKGNGVFDGQQTYLTDYESHPCSVAIGHLDADNYMDLAVASYATNNISIFLGNGDGTFINHRQFSTGSSHPLFVTTGDVNNDNATDLLVVNYGTNSVGVHLGYGNGSFHDQRNYFIEYDSLPHSLALGDFNRDNHLDIAVANYGTSNIGILLGYGDGTFANQTTYTTLSNSHPSSLALGDFNHDDQLDIVVSNNGSGNVGIFFGHGDGSFEAQRIYLLDRYSHPEYITVADLNGDNELDVIVVDSIKDRVHILRGDGNGSFATITTYDTVHESSPKSVGVGDFNRNNQSDIVVVNHGTNNVLVLMDYWTKPSTRQANYNTGEPDVRVAAMVVSDFNNDHIPDIVSTSTSTIFLLSGLDDGSFDGRLIFTINTSLTNIKHISTGDVNNDNWMDIVAINSLDDNVGVLLGYGNGTFGSMVTYSTGSGWSASQLALGDMNGDGRLDIVFANRYSDSIAILFGHGDGTFATGMIYSTGNDSIPASVALGDINHDHHLDAVVGDDNGYIVIFIGNNNETLTLCSRFHVSGLVETIVLADLNSDNNLDIIIIYQIATVIGVLLGYGDGTFTTETTYPMDDDTQVCSLVVADFNNDYMLDLAITSTNNDGVMIFYGNGDGSLTLTRRYSTGIGSEPCQIAVAYFDHIKQLEIIVGLRGTNEVAVLTEYTSAEFVKQAVYSTGSTAQPFSVAAGDFNHDNRSDVVVANSGTDDLSILIGSGNDMFETEMVYGIGANSHPQYVITCDIDQDQQLDIVSVNSKLDSITVIIGQSDGTFANERTYSTGNGSHPSAVAGGDLNNDGRLDLVVANEGKDSIGVLFGFNYTAFQSPVIYSDNDSLEPYGIVVSDFNNDGFQDIASVFSGSGKIGIYLGCGNGSFILAITYFIGDRIVPTVTTASDLNTDGRVDIIVSDYATGNIGILLGYGNGSFATATMYLSIGSSPMSVAVGDINNDDRLDLVVAYYDTSNMGVLYGHGDGTFSMMQLYYIAQNFRPESINLWDVNNDGQLDAVLLNTFSGKSGLSIIYGDGVFRDEVISSTITTSQPRRVAVADFNNDNRLDIAVAGYNTDSVGMLLNNGNGTFAPWIFYSGGSGFAPSSLEVGDFNNDNVLDIVVVCFSTNDIFVLFGVGDGSFLLGSACPSGIVFGPWAVAIGDFNNDTRLDIAVNTVYANNMVVFLGGHSEPFANVQKYTTGGGSQPHAVAVGDVNNDHHMDIVVANYGTDNVGVLLGRNDREFTSMDAYPTGTGSAPYCVAIADFNNDNFLDIVVTTSETDNIVVLLGNDNGTFVINATYSTGYRSRPYTLVVSDFNNDQIWDIAIANSGTSNIFLFYGYGNGTFGNEISYSLGYGYHPYSIAVTDLNGDGWMDIVAACYDTDHIETFIQMC